MDVRRSDPAIVIDDYFICILLEFNHDANNLSPYIDR